MWRKRFAVLSVQHKKVKNLIILRYWDILSESDLCRKSLCTFLHIFGIKRSDIKSSRWFFTCTCAWWRVDFSQRFGRIASVKILKCANYADDGLLHDVSDLQLQVHRTVDSDSGAACVFTQRSLSLFSTDTLVLWSLCLLLSHTNSISTVIYRPCNLFQK